MAEWLSLADAVAANVRDGDIVVMERAGLSGKGPAALITGLCILRPDPVSRELTVTSVHFKARTAAAHGVLGEAA